MTPIHAFITSLPDSKEERFKQFVDKLAARLGSRKRVSSGKKLSAERLETVLVDSQIDFEEFLRQYHYFDELTTCFAEMEFFERIAWHRVLMEQLEGCRTNDGALHAIKDRAIDAFSILSAAEMLNITPDGLLGLLEKEVSRNNDLVASIRQEPTFTNVVFMALAA